MKTSPRLIVHFWTGTAFDCNLEDILSDEQELGLTAQIEYSSDGTIWACQVTEVILFYHNNTRAHLEEGLRFEILKELSKFMLKDYREKKAIPQDPLWLFKAQQENGLEGA